MTKGTEKRQELLELLTSEGEPRRAIVVQSMEQLEEVYGKGILSKL